MAQRILWTPVASNNTVATRPTEDVAVRPTHCDLFLGLENLSKRRYRYLGLPLPGGPESHSEILEQFLADADLGGRLGNDVAELDSHKFVPCSDRRQRSASRLINSMFRIVISSTMASSRL